VKNIKRKLANSICEDIKISFKIGLDWPVSEITFNRLREPVDEKIYYSFWNSFKRTFYGEDFLF